MMTEANRDLLVALCLQPGVLGVDVYDDGMEICGSTEDQDASAGFIVGAFDPADVRAVVPALEVTDQRGQGFDPVGVPS